MAMVMASPPTDRSATRQTLYFAYGSNLSLAQMRSRCPTSTYSGVGLLKGWKWIIGTRGYANVISVPPPVEKGGGDGDGEVGKDGGEEEGMGEREWDQVVYGLLYTLGEQDEENLDIAEGVPECYHKLTLQVSFTDADGVETGAGVKALVYVDEKRTGEGYIKGEYVRRMNRGIRDAVRLGVPRGYVQEVLRRWVREGKEGDGEEVRDPFHPGTRS